MTTHKPSHLDDFKNAVEAGKRAGLIAGPGSATRNTSAAPLPASTTTAATAGEIKLHVTVEEVSPEKASLWLKSNLANRKLKTSTVKAYARDMKMGKWLLTHQSVAFNTRGELLDGQHRLMAIIQSGCTVRLLIMRGFPVEQLGALTMDAVDRGVTRSIADQLGLHGFSDANLLAGCAVMVARLCCADKAKVRKLTVPQTLAILDVYREDLMDVIQKRSTLPGLRSATLIGTMAFARAGAGGEVMEFYHALVTGENLRAGSPALVLRNWLMGKADFAGGHDRIQQSEMMLHAVHSHILRQSIDRMVWNRAGVDFFRGKQTERASKVLSLFL